MPFRSDVKLAADGEVFGTFENRDRVFNEAKEIPRKLDIVKY